MRTVSLSLRLCYGAFGFAIMAALAASPVLAGRSRVLPPSAFHHTGTVYVSDQVTQQIFEFPAGVQNPMPIGMLSSGLMNPNGLWVTGNGDLYVANGHNLVAFHRGGSRPFRQLRLSLTTDSAIDVAVDRLGRVYALAFAASGAGKIEEYDPGQTVPKRIVRLPFRGQHTYYPSIGVANGASEFFVSYDVIDISTLYGDVERFRRNGDTPTFLGLHLEEPHGIGFDSKRNMVVADNFDREIFFYAPGTTTPYRTINTPTGPTALRVDQTVDSVYAVIFQAQSIKREVVIYLAGQSTPFTTIAGSGSSPFDFLGVAIDD